jgi:signal transduction histidine kinase
MRQRVAAHGGRFDIRRGVPNGTDIHVVMPSASTATPSVDFPPATPSRSSV